MASSSSTQELWETNQDQEQHLQHQQWQPVKEFMHKTKTVHFLGRTTPIVLQNVNGPCPLLAICNVLLLRNNLNLSPDIDEVSQEKLLALIAEILIDSNGDVNNKDAGYVQNQQQNIADAIDLLPRLATGIDVNLKFRRIDDFEFTPECAIFDLLGIPLYHGWIVDPQDYDTVNAMGSKSYNALMGELVALETQNMDGQYKHIPEEDCIDFVAATTAALGVPSPNLSKARSFDDSPHFISDNQKRRKGGLEDEAELLRALKLSEADSLSGSDPLVGHANEESLSASVDKNTHNKGVMVIDSGDELENNTVGTNDLHEPEHSLPDGCIGPAKNSNEQRSSASTLEEAVKLSLKTNAVNDLDQSTCKGTEKSMGQNDVVKKDSLDTLVQEKSSALLSSAKDSVSLHGSHAPDLVGDKKVHDQSTLTTSDNESAEPHGYDATRLSCLSATHTNSDFSGKIRETDVSEALSSSVDGSEPIYEGEECVLGARTATSEDCEPVYEGEVLLAEQAGKSTLGDSNLRARNEITTQQGELIRNFLRNNASQLTFYGLFSLQDGLKERELCVFFRNNHFSTMFKFEGELYLLATDQGYINQPDLVWEKLNEVNGDTLFMNGNFKEFVLESHENNIWDEHNAMTSTAEYLASIDSAGQAGLDINSDLQLAIALQQQEFEEQPLRHNSQQFSNGGSSRQVTDPQVARNTGRLSASSTSSSSSSPKADGKSKERCIVM